MRKPIMFAAAAMALTIPSAAMAVPTLGPISFEEPTYHVGDINGQDSWQKTGPYDVAVASTSQFNFAAQALRISNAVTSGSFGDQTHSPPVDQAKKHFEASFNIGTMTDALQPGLAMSVSPDDGNGARMSYLRFEDQTNGVHVFFNDAIPGKALPDNPDPDSGAQRFTSRDVATLNRSSAHTVRFVMDLKSTQAADTVKITIDGKQIVTGASWKGYYLHDTESGPPHVPGITNLSFYVRSGSYQGSGGYLIDNVSLASS